MAASEQQRNALFSLRLEQGVGRLVLSERRISDLLVIDEMRLSLAELPSRLDMSGGVERFRHQRTRLERLVVHIDDHDLSRCLDGYLNDAQLMNLEARAVDGDLVVIGEAGHRQTPFLLRMRLETGTVGEQRAALLSVYEARTYGPSDLAAPQLAGRFLTALGFDHQSNGPTVISFDPIIAILDEVSAELGWKGPDHSELKITEIESSGGQIRLVCDTQRPVQLGPRRLETSFENSAKVRRFMADYEAKQLYQNTEALIDEGRIERAIRHYDRQSELHPDNGFLANRLMQLQVMSVDTLADAADTASRRLARYPDDTDALLTLSNVHWQRGDLERAADLLDRVAEAAERRADLLEAAQARCALAIVMSDGDPERALEALKSALGLRRGLVAARKRLSELQAQAGDWVAALKTRESILASESSAERRCELLVELGHLALSHASDMNAALNFFERALVEMPGRIHALLGLATAQEQNDDFLSAVRTLDRASRLLQERGQTDEAADVIVRLGHLWTKEPGDGITTASLRFRQALMLVPGHPGALYGLADVAVVEGDHVRARSALEELLRSVDEGRTNIEKDRLYLRLGQILQTLGEESRLAVVYFQKATDGPWVVAKPAFDALEEINSAAENWGDVARVLERSLLRSEDDDDRVARLCRLTTIVSERHGDPTRAIELLEAAVSSLPQQRDLLNPLAALYRHAADTEKLAATLGRLAELNTDPVVLVDIYLEQAGLLSTELNQVDVAVEAYAKALGCDPENLVALDGLIDITRERERFGELAALLDRRAVLSEASEAAGLRFELAQIYARQLMKPDAAIEQLKRAKDSDSSATHVLRLLGDLYFEADRLDLALVQYEILKTIYDAEGYDEPVAGFLIRIAEVFDGLGRFSESLDMIRAAIDRDPERIQTYARGQELVLNGGQLSDVLALLRYGLDRAGQPKARTYLCVRLGRLLWRELRKPDEAREVLSEAAMYESGDRDVRRMRIEIATALGDWTEVAELLKVQLDTADLNERPAILVSLAKLAYDELDRPDEGFQFAQAALAEVDDYIPALTLLADKSFALENWVIAQKTLIKLLHLEGVHARPDDRFRLALTHLELGQDSLSYEELRTLRNEGSYIPGLSIAMARACVQLGQGRVLATLVDELLDEAADADAGLLIRVADTLRSDSDHEGLAQRCLDAAAAFDGAMADRIESSTPMGSEETIRATMPLPVIHQTQLEMRRVEADTESQHDLGQHAILTTREVGSLDRVGVSMDDAYEDTLASLSDTYAADDDELPPLASRRLPTDAEIQNPADAAAQLRVRVNELGDTPDAAPTWLQLAELIRDRMHDPDGAVPCFERVLELADATSDEWLESVEALEDLFAIREDWSSLLELYDVRLANQPENTPAIQLLRASVLNTIGRLDEAKEAAEQALPLGDRARELLISILETQGDSERIAELLLSDLDDLGKTDRGYRYWRAADTAQKTDQVRALEYLSQASKLLIDPDLARQFLDVARQVDDAELRVHALFYQADQLGESTAAAVRRSSLLAEAAKVLEPTGDLERIRLVLEDSLNAWAENVEAISALSRCLEQLNDDEALFSLLDTEMSLIVPGLHRGRAALKLAHLAKRLGYDAEQIAKYVRLALGDLEGTEHEQEVRDSFREFAVQPLSDVTQSLLEQARDKLHEGGDVESIVTLLEDVLGLDSQSLDAYELLGELYTRADMIAELVSVLERHATVLGPNRRRAQLRIRRARLTHERLQDPQGATEQFKIVLADSAADFDATRESLEAIGQLATDASVPEQCIRIMSERIANGSDAEEIAWLLSLRGQLHESVINDVELARDDYRQALQNDPDYGPALLAMGQTDEERGEQQTAVVFYRRALETTTTGLNASERLIAFDGAVRGFEALDLGDDLIEFAMSVAERYPDSKELQLRVQDVVEASS